MKSIAKRMRRARDARLSARSRLLAAGVALSNEPRAWKDGDVIAGLPATYVMLGYTIAESTRTA